MWSVISKTTVLSTPSASVWFQTRHHHSSRGREQAREIPLEGGGRGWGGGGLLKSTEQPPLWWNSFINGSNCTCISQGAANRGESRQGEKGTPSSCVATTQPLATETDGGKKKKKKLGNGCDNNDDGGGAVTERGAPSPSSGALRTGNERAPSVWRLAPHRSPRRRSPGP